MLTNIEFEEWLKSHTDAEQAVLTTFQGHLDRAISALFNSIAAISSGSIEPNQSLAVNIISAAIKLIPVAGTILSEAVNFVAAEVKKSEFISINALLGQAPLISSQFAMQAVHYHGAEIIAPVTEKSSIGVLLEPVFKTLDKAKNAVLWPTGLSEAQTFLLQALLLKLTQGLREAAVLYANHRLPLTQLSTYLATHAFDISEKPLHDVAFDKSYAQTSVYHRYAVAFEMLRLSTLAYQDQTLIAKRAKAWVNDEKSDFFYIMREDIRCFVFSHNHTIVCSFRGTVPKTITNIVTDINITTNITSVGVIHAGFNKALQKIWAPLEEYLSKRLEQPEIKSIILTGHSLGGALALLAGAQLYNAYTKIQSKLTVLTFGQPKIGKSYRLPDDFKQRVFRFVNTGDPVARLPLHPYEHIGHEYIVPNSDALFDWQANNYTAIQVGEHSLREYRRRLTAHHKSECTPITMPALLEVYNSQEKLDSYLNTYPKLHDPTRLVTEIATLILDSSFPKNSVARQCQLLRLFSTALNQSLCQSGGLGLQLDIENALARLNKRKQGQAGQVVFELERASLLLHLAQFPLKANNNDFRNLFNESFKAFNSTFDYSTLCADITKIMDQDDSLKAHVALAPLVIITVLTTLPKLAPQNITSLRNYFHQNPPQHELVQIGLLLLLARSTNMLDYWSLLVEAEQLDLSFWLQENKVITTPAVAAYISIVLAQLPNNPVTQAILNEPHYDLSKALLKLSSQSDVDIATRLKALQTQQKLIQKQGKALGYEDYSKLAELEALSDDIAAAKASYIQALQLSNNAPILARAEIQKDLKNKIIALILPQAMTCSGWDKSLVYLEGLRYDENHEGVIAALFAQVLGPEIGNFAQKLQAIATPIVVGSVNELTKLCKEGAVLLQTTFNGWWQLKPEAVLAFENRTHIRQSVHKVALCGEIYIKENPGCVGLAFSAWALSRTLFFDMPSAPANIGMVPVQPARIMQYQNNYVRAHYVQLSPQIIGANVQSLLTQNADPNELKNLESMSFSALVILSILLNMEDARDANFILSEINQLKYLVSIDNDHVLIRDEVSESILKTNIEIKNLVYCLQDMQKPIDATVRNHLNAKEFSPILRILVWLYQVFYYNQEIEKLFSAKTIEDLFNRANENEKVILPTFFEATGVMQPLIKLNRLDNALRAFAVKNHQDLLMYVQPKVARIYQKSFAKPRLRERLAEIGGLTGPSLSTSAELARKVTGHKTRDYLEFVQTQRSPRSMLVIMHEICRDKSIVNIIIQEIARGELTTFIRSPELQALVLSKLNSAYYTSIQYTPIVHSALLQAIHSDVTEITFQENPLLTDDELYALITRLPKLTNVTLEGCVKLTGYKQAGLFGSKVSWLEEICKPGVKTIKLVRCENLSGQLLEVLPKLWQQFPQIEWDIQAPTTWATDTLAQIAINYPDKGLLIPKMESVFLRDDAGIQLTFSIEKEVCALTVLPIGWLVSGTIDGTIIISEVNTQSARRVHSFKGHSEQITALAALTNGWLVGGTKDGTIIIWEINAQSARQVHTFKGHSEQITALTALVNGVFVSAAKDGTITVWEVNADSVTQVHTTKLQSNYIGALTTLHNGLLVSAAKDQTITIWKVNTASFAPLHNFQGFQVNAKLALLTNGSFVEADQTLHVWKVRLKSFRILEFSSQVIERKDTFGGRFEFITALTASPSGWLAWGTTDGTIKIYNCFKYTLDDRLNNSSKANRLVHNAQELLKRNQLHIEQVPLLFNNAVAKNLSTLDVSHSGMTESLFQAIKGCCPSLTIKHEDCPWQPEWLILEVRPREKLGSTILPSISLNPYKFKFSAHARVSTGSSATASTAGTGYYI